MPMRWAIFWSMGIVHTPWWSFKLRTPSYRVLFSERHPTAMHTIVRLPLGWRFVIVKRSI
jgi:hypothetical protein